MAHRQLIDSRRPPAGIRVQCPACESWVRLSDDDVIRCTGTLEDGSPCSEWGTIEHWRQLVAGDADHPMTAVELVEWLARHHRYSTRVETIWQWASRGTRYGKLTRIDTYVEGEHLDTCATVADRVGSPLQPVTAGPSCTGCVAGIPRYDPVRAAELVMLMRNRNAG